MVKIQSNYDGKCCKCGTAYVRGAKIGYDANAKRGQKAYCLNCAGTALFVPDATEAEIASIKQQLDAKEEQAVESLEEYQRERKPVATPEPAAAPVGDLAAIIAAAVAPMVKGQLDEARVRQMMAEFMTPPTHTITVKSPAIPEGVNVGRQHRQFKQLLMACSARTKDGFRLNVSMTGSAGTGKTTAAHMVSKALGLEFSSTGSLTDTYKIFGFVKPSDGEAVITAFRERWTKGGVFLFDDFDASDPAATVEANHPLANGHYTFPDGKTEARHPDCILIMTMNTWGYGASDDYVGRVKQDKAFLDRFVQIDWEIDEGLERDLATDKQWVTYVQSVRNKVKRLALKVLVTPRATFYGEALLQTGMDIEFVKAMTLKKGMTPEQWSSVC